MCQCKDKRNFTCCIFIENKHTHSNPPSTFGKWASNTWEANVPPSVPSLPHKLQVHLCLFDEINTK